MSACKTCSSTRKDKIGIAFFKVHSAAVISAFIAEIALIITMA